MIEIETVCGDDISKKCYEAYHVAVRTKEPVTFSFNGIQVIMYDKSDPSYAGKP